MSFVLGILIAIVGGGVLALGIVLIRFNRKRLRIARIAAAASDDVLESIYRHIEGTNSENPAGCVLGRTNKTVPHERSLVRLPHHLVNFPWSGRCVEIEAGGDVVCQFIDEPVHETTFAGRVFRLVRVPRKRLSSGKFRNVFSPKRLVGGNHALASALRHVCPQWPEEFLSYLLCVGRESFEFEPIDQARIGTSPAWVQGPEWPHCAQCGRRMGLILQIPGTLLSPKGRGTHYWFGCEEHTELTKGIVQFT